MLITTLLLCLVGCETLENSIRETETETETETEIVAEKISSSSAIEENKIYEVEVKYDKDGIWIPRVYPQIWLHHALSLHWENIDDFPELKNPQEGTTKKFTFRVTKIDIEYSLYLQGTTRVNVLLDTVLCTIIEVE